MTSPHEASKISSGIGIPEPRRTTLPDSGRTPTDARSLTAEQRQKLTSTPERLIRIGEVKRRAGLGKTMIYRLIQQGRFPAPYKLSPSVSLWSEQELIAWIDEVKDGFEGKKRKF